MVFSYFTRFLHCLRSGWNTFYTFTKNFETTMNELTKLIETHSSHNAALRDENKMLASKMQELLKEFETRESKIGMVRILSASYSIILDLEIFNIRVTYVNSVEFH